MCTAQNDLLNRLTDTSLFADVFLEAYVEAPSQIILDVDATEDPLHGSQEGKFSMGGQGLLLPAVIHFLWGTFIVCPVADSRQ